LCVLIRTKIQKQPKHSRRSLATSMMWCLVLQAMMLFSLNTRYLARQLCSSKMYVIDFLWVRTMTERTIICLY